MPALEDTYRDFVFRHLTFPQDLYPLPISGGHFSPAWHTSASSSSPARTRDLRTELDKPMQRLLSYPVFLSTILNEMSKDNVDNESMLVAKKKMEEVSLSISKEGQRHEVIKAFLTSSTVQRLTAIANSRGTSHVQSLKKKYPIEKASKVAKLEETLYRHVNWMKRNQIAIKEWADSIHVLFRCLATWGIDFSEAVGLPESTHNIAVEAFLEVTKHQLLLLCHNLDSRIEKLLNDISNLLDSTHSPLAVLEMMHSFEPLHYFLIHITKSRRSHTRPPPELIQASQYYVLFLEKMHTELGQYVSLLERSMVSCLCSLSQTQAQFWLEVADRWHIFWGSLREEGEDITCASQTVALWRSRFGKAEYLMLDLRILE
jgi:dynamin-binding protein